VLATAPQKPPTVTRKLLIIRNAATTSASDHEVTITKNDEGQVQGVTGVEVTPVLPPETDSVIVACCGCGESVSTLLRQPSWLD